MTAVEKSKLITSILALVEAQTGDYQTQVSILGAAYLSVTTPALKPAG